MDDGHALILISVECELLVGICANKRNFLLQLHNWEVHWLARSSLHHISHRHRKDQYHKPSDKEECAGQSNLHLYCSNFSLCRTNSILEQAAKPQKARLHHFGSPSRQKVHLLHWRHQHASSGGVWGSAANRNVETAARQPRSVGPQKSHFQASVRSGDDNKWHLWSDLAAFKVREVLQHYLYPIALGIVLSFNLHLNHQRVLPKVQNKAINHGLDSQ